MLAFLTDKLKNQHIGESSTTTVSSSTVGCVRGCESRLKSESKILERRWHRSGRINRPPVDDNFRYTDHRLGSKATGDRTHNSSVIFDPPNKKQCRSVPSEGGSYTCCRDEDINNRFTWPMSGAALDHSQTFLPVPTVNWLHSFNFSTPDVSHVTAGDQSPVSSPMFRSVSASGGFLAPRATSHPPPSASSLYFRSLSLEDHHTTPRPARRLSHHGLSSGRYIARCRSQPCVMSDRKCGVKRRHDKDRPALDFAKMTETAYEHVVLHSGPTRIRHKSACSARFKEELLPIASSPLDHETSLHQFTSPPRSPIRKTGMDYGVEACTDSGCSDLDDRDATSHSATYNSCSRDEGRDDSCCQDYNCSRDNTDVEDGIDDDDDGSEVPAVVEDNGVFLLNELDVNEIELH